MEFNINNRHHKREDYFRKNFNGKYLNILGFSYDKNIPFTQKLYNYINNISTPPKCYCGKVLKFKNIKQGYFKYCSIKCASNSNEIKDKTRNTNLKKYGVECVLKSNLIKEKIKKTNLKKYGVDNPSKNDKIIDKIRNKKTDKERNYWKNILGNNIDVDYLDHNTLKISNHCSIHKTFEIKRQTLYSRLFRQKMENVCTICTPLNENISNLERGVQKFIDDLGIENEKLIIGKQEIDIFLPDYNLGIEFNGLYYHSIKFKNKHYHQKKTELAEKNKIRLIHIFEDEWVNKEEIVKSIIKSKLNIFNKKICARKCEVREIKNNQTIREFLETNHIQGFIGSKIKIGLFHENELVSLMAFGKKRVALGSKSNDFNTYEIFRFCSKLNTQVIGDANKLLNFFIRKYSPNEIITFIDRRYGNGSLYNNMGFKCEKKTKPNYCYFNINGPTIRFHRYNFRKQKLVNEGFNINDSENKIMEKRNYLRIYDSGNLKYVLNLK